MKDFKKRFVSNLPKKIQSNLNKTWIVADEDFQDQNLRKAEEAQEINLMKNPTGKVLRSEAKKAVKFTRNNDLIEGKQTNEIQF